MRVCMTLACVAAATLTMVSCDSTEKLVRPNYLPSTPLSQEIASLARRVPEGIRAAETAQLIIVPTQNTVLTAHFIENCRNKALTDAGLMGGIVDSGFTPGKAAAEKQSNSELIFSRLATTLRANFKEIKSSTSIAEAITSSDDKSTIMVLELAGNALDCSTYNDHFMGTSTTSMQWDGIQASFSMIAGDNSISCQRDLGSLNFKQSGLSGAFKSRAKVDENFVTWLASEIANSASTCIH